MQELTAGTLLGNYKVVRRLGQGGMGVVYEAEDQKLGRSVAIKLLPEATRREPAALERFWREARTASSLNHPGICINQPIDGSPTHLMIDPTPELLTWTAISPSGSKVAVTKSRRSSDVVLITDLAGKQPH